MCVGETQADGRVNCVRGTGGKSLEAKDPGEGDLLAWPWPWPWARGPALWSLSELCQPQRLIAHGRALHLLEALGICRNLTLAV